VNKHHATAASAAGPATAALGARWVSSGRWNMGGVGTS
jgi:hypothetical protein